jgi:hypothetical protein
VFHVKQSIREGHVPRETNGCLQLRKTTSSAGRLALQFDSARTVPEGSNGSSRENRSGNARISSQRRVRLRSATPQAMAHKRFIGPHGAGKLPSPAHGNTWPEDCRRAARARTTLGQVQMTPQLREGSCLDGGAPRQCKTKDLSSGIAERDAREPSPLPRSTIKAGASGSA